MCIVCEAAKGNEDAIRELAELGLSVGSAGNPGDDERFCVGATVQDLSGGYGRRDSDVHALALMERTADYVGELVAVCAASVELQKALRQVSMRIRRIGILFATSRGDDEVTRQARDVTIALARAGTETAKGVHLTLQAQLEQLSRGEGGIASEPSDKPPVATMVMSELRTTLDGFSRALNQRIRQAGR